MRNRLPPPCRDGLVLPWYSRFQVSIPACELGPWRVRVHRLEGWAPIPGVDRTWQGVRMPAFYWPGEYRMLERHTDEEIEIPVDGYDVPDDEDPTPCTCIRTSWKTWMSDCPVEICSMLGAVRRFRGRVLIGGLGLGVLIKAALMRRDVESVTVLEIDEEVLALVGPHYRDPRLQILREDALEFRPRGRRWYDAVYMDIWRDVGACNLVDMLKLRRRWIDACGWYGAWSEDRARVQLKSGESLGCLSEKNRAFALEVLEACS